MDMIQVYQIQSTQIQVYRLQKEGSTDKYSRENQWKWLPDNQKEMKFEKSY